MQFEEKSELYAHKVEREGNEDILYVNYLGVPFVPSIADYPEVMERTIDSLIENPNASRIVFVQQKNYNYDLEETTMLMEISQLYIYLIRQEKILSRAKLITSQENLFSKRYNDVFNFLFLLKQDPIMAYSEMKKLIVESSLALERLEGTSQLDERSYISTLKRILELIENTSLIRKAIPFMGNYSKGEREVYKNLFRADVIPNFTFTRLVYELPRNAEIVDQHKISQGIYDESLVTILKLKERLKR